jgi:hypothetical protein
VNGLELDLCACVGMSLDVTQTSSLYLTFVSGRLEDFSCICHKCQTLNYHICSVSRFCAPASSDSAPLLPIGLLLIASSAAFDTQFLGW